MKNRKAEIVTLLALGLIILGGVLAIGSSVFLSQQKTTSTRAAGCGSGGRFDCNHSDINRSICTTKYLEFACCVKDNYLCGGEPRYRWYGCTGQPCANTGINNSYHHLFGCPSGVNQGNPESCERELTSTQLPTPPPSSGSCIVYNLAADCASFCSGNHPGWSCEGGNACCPPTTPSPSTAVTPAPAPTTATPSPGTTGTAPSPTTPPNTTATPVPSPTMIVEGNCIASGTKIEFLGYIDGVLGVCTYFEVSGQQNCSNTTPVYNEKGCIVFRVCGGSLCRYDCYAIGKNGDGEKTSCEGVNDPQTGYDYIRIINSSSNDIVIGRIVIEKLTFMGSNPNVSLDGVTLKPGEIKAINLNEIGGTFACSAISLNSIKVWLFKPDQKTVLTSAQDDCMGGVKILINLK